MEDPEKLLRKHPSRDFIELLISYANEIYSTLGPGYSESVYHKAFEVHLRENQVPYQPECIVPIQYKGHCIGNVRADIVLHRPTNRQPFFIIEFKATVKQPGAPEVTQLKTYLKALDLENGLVINFPQVGYNDYRETTDKVDFFPVRI